MTQNKQKELIKHYPLVSKREVSVIPNGNCFNFPKGRLRQTGLIKG